MEDALEKQILQQQLDYQQTAQKFFKMGKEDILEKVKAISSLWASNKLTNDDFARQLNNLIQIYDKND